MKKLNSFITRLFAYTFFVSLFIILLIIGAYIHLESHLPDVDTLKNVQLQVPLRVFTSDGELMAEFGEKRRIPVSLDQIPKPLIHALLATEDQRFYDHPGVDIWGLLRAGVQIIRTGEKVQGGSTITMQVARNFFLNRKKTYIRKLNEILLAIKIDQELSKDKVLELYLNKIYFGNRAYGVAAAAQVYYGKTLNELTLQEMAMLAGIPKAPSQLNPLSNPQAAKKRRDHVLTRMLEQGYIDHHSYMTATNTPLSAAYHGRKVTVNAAYAAEVVRLLMVEKYGKDAYTNGYQVYTTIDSKWQDQANRSVQQTLLAYERRHGYRGRVNHINLNTTDWRESLRHLPRFEELQPAVITQTAADKIEVRLLDNTNLILDSSGLDWARGSHHLSVGDVIYVTSENGQWYLSQIPEVEGALVGLNPNDGAIKVLVGGFDFDKSHFNRVTQAKRQPGSSFKPFIYTAALEKGYTLASIVNDAPFVVDDPTHDTFWRPQNDNRRFYGPTRLRVGLVRSRNLVSIRILDDIGIDYVVDYLKRFGFSPDELPHTLSLALGTLELTPLQLASAYAIFANGGFHVDPYLIQDIKDIHGQTIATTHPKIANFAQAVKGHQDSDKQPAPRVIAPPYVYLINSALQDVVQQGTGEAAKILNRRDIAGKTGTTNDQNDGWFAGYHPDLVVVCWIGYDQRHSLQEYAAKSALPMWINFMKSALSKLPQKTMTIPTEIVTASIDPKTGLLVDEESPNSIQEFFLKDSVPQQYAPNGASKESSESDNQEETEEPDDYLF